MTEVSLERSSGLMALGTIASRATGFLRVSVMAAALGITVTGGLADPYNIANTTPNILYELLLGGVVTSVVVPLLVRTSREDADGGDGFAQLLLTAVALVLGTAVVAGVLAAPWIATALGASGGAERAATTTFLRWFLPQILFYGVGATITAILNTRGRFGVPMVAPALNNLVVAATGLLFLAQVGGRPTVHTVTGGQLALLGLGTTLGVVVMTVALWPSLHASGFRWRPQLGRHPALREAFRLGRWVLVYVVANQIGLFVIVRLAKAAVDGGYTAYQYAFLLFQLPHAIVTVSVATALVPRMSRHAADGALADLRADLSRGARLVAVVLVPAALALAVLAGPICTVVFQYRAASPDQAGFVASVLPAFACGLVSFSAYLLLLRVCYTLADSRTPALVNIAANAVNVTADVLLFVVLDGRARVVGLAFGHAIAYTFGAVVLARLLSRRLGGLDGRRIVRTAVRALVAAAPAALAAAALAAVLPHRTPPAALLAVLVAAGAGAVIYVSAARRMRVEELAAVATLVTGRFARRS
jgi:putative peptidoglycan lipid II flippase